MPNTFLVLGLLLALIGLFQVVQRSPGHPASPGIVTAALGFYIAFLGAIHDLVSWRAQIAGIVIVAAVLLVYAMWRYVRAERHARAMRASEERRLEERIRRSLM